MDATKSLNAVNDVLSLDTGMIGDFNGGFGFQRDAGSGDTVIVEGRVADTQAWVPLGLKTHSDPDAAAIATGLTIGAGAWWGNAVGLDGIRVRKTIGANPCIVSLNVKPG